MSDACAMSSRGNTRGEPGPDKSRRHDTSSAISRRMDLLESRLNPRIEGAMPDTLSMTALHPIADQCAPASLEVPATGVHQSQTLRAVNLAAERHMQKVGMTSRAIPAPAPPSASSWHPGNVVGDSPQQLTNLNSSNTAGSFSLNSRSPPFTALPSPSVSASISGMSFSNQTLITSHTRQKQGVASSVTDRGVRVSETPPAGEASQDSDTRRGGGSNCSHNSAKHQLTIGQSIGSREAVQSAKRKSVPIKRALASISVNTGRPSHDQTNGQTSLSTGMEAAKKRGRPNAKKANNRQDELGKTMGADEQANSDLRLGEPLSTSRDPTGSLSNPSPTGGPQRTPPFSKRSPAPNNRLISQFFGSSKKKSEGSREKASPTRSGDRSRQEQAAAFSPSRDVISPTTRLELDRLREKCQQWEKICSDQEQQLKAVANNQSIMHHALKGVLTERENDIDRLKEEMQQRASESMKAIERFVRTESARQEKDLRQKLASDGARLGRIVYTRTGMHTVESWEDGHDAKLLKKRRSELRHQRLELEKRHKLAQDVEKQISDGNGLDGAENVLQDDLDVMEAQESVRRHLDILKQKELDLSEEEKALHIETGIHIRSLKLVSSEDCSRFKSKEKLHDRYVPLSLLGKGGFSEVWKAYDLSELREVAVKIHQLDPRWSEAKKENYTKHVSREYEIHRDVRHPRIVSLYDVFEIDSNSFATVLECCSGNDLDSLLKEKLVLPERDSRAILLQILSGMRYLSMASPDGTRQGIIHYDLKPGNILFDENGDAKITDFGLSKIVDESDAGDSMELTSQGAGTYWYLPPECFMTHANVRISNKVDVWSIGVIYYQMVFGKRPFGDGQSQDKVLSHGVMLNAREVKFPPKPEVSDECKEFIRQCLMYDQTFRPTVSQLCQQPYLHQKNL
eukprot:scaffold43359_cov58-Attheya_sp.AAC.6